MGKCSGVFNLLKFATMLKDSPQIGSIIFSNEEDIMHGSMVSIDFYSNIIAPDKGALEE